MSPYTLSITRAKPPILCVHGGAGAYLKTTTAAQRAERGMLLADALYRGYAAFSTPSGARGAVLSAIASLEADPRFNAGLGAKVQQDGRARLSASLMSGRDLRMSAVYNVEDCLHPSALADALQARGDRNLDGLGARRLMLALGVAPFEVRTPEALSRWMQLADAGDTADPEGAIGDAGLPGLARARAAALPVPDDLRPLSVPSSLPTFDSDPTSRSGTVGAVALDLHGDLWACTSTGGRGHEHPGRVSDSPTPAGNYACAAVALSATGFGEQIIDLNLCGRVATRMLDGASLTDALRRTFDEVAARQGLMGLIAVAADGTVGYAYTTEACGIAWLDADNTLHLDPHSAPPPP